MMLFDPSWVQASKWGVREDKCSREEGQKRSRPICRGKGWHSRERKLNESKCEGHVALRGEVDNRVSRNHIWVKLCFCFCNLIARIYKVRHLCSQASAFGHESAKSVSAQ
jgi:hypothetical protein